MSRKNYHSFIKLPVIAFFLFLFHGLLFAQSAANSPLFIKPDREYKDFQIKISEENSLVFELEANSRYSIVVEQKGIDLLLRLTDAQGKLIKEQDSPNGNDGPEQIYFAPENKARFFLTVKPLQKPKNPPAGSYSIRVSRISENPPTFKLGQLVQDFDLLTGSLKEAHTGLNWYSTYKEFDDFCANQKKLLRDRMTVLEFYRVIAPIVAFTKEGHASIRLSAGDTAYFQAFASYFPFQIKFLQGQAYIINDFDGIKAKGFLLTKINGKSIGEIVKTLLSVEPDDGYIVSGKYRWIEENGSFPSYYLNCFGSAPNFTVELLDPKTNKQITLDKVRGVKYAEYRQLWRESVLFNESNFPAAKIEFQPEIKTAILTYNKFNTLFRNEKFDFSGFTDKAFDEIRKRDVEHLIIDVRKNSGGEEGLEDYLFAYLTNQPYTKYRYVQSSGPTFSFLDYTNFNTKQKQENLAKVIREEHYLSSDGRLLRRKETLPRAEPRIDAYTGKLYVLTGGLTYSGGSEFAAIVKGNRQAAFIGEETGGGFYGNTSGFRIALTIPNSQIVIRIPLLKFVVEVASDKIPFGRGVIPDYDVQPTIDEYLSGVDAEMNFALKLIRDGK